MPSHNQFTVDITPNGNGQLGNVGGLSRSNTNSLKSSFPGSPIHSGALTRDNVQTQFQKLALDGVVQDGYCFSSFNRDYPEAPTIANVVFGPGGLPGGPHIPNPASPGAGTVNPTNMPAPPAGWEANNTTRPPFSGEGSALEPSASSAAQGAQKVKDYVLGKSIK